MYRRLFSLIIVFFVGINAVYAQDTQWMPDPILRKVVRAELNIAEGKSLTKADMPRLLVVKPERTEQIIDLTGLEYAVKLHTLLLWDHRVQDLRPIANLTNLRYLSFNRGPISDITPLAGLVNLETLSMWNNQIVDVSPLANLINLRVLQLPHNQIEDFSPLSGLVNLEWLEIQRNKSSDISAIPTSKLKDFVYDETCSVPSIPVADRIENREYPSVSGSWSYVPNKPPIISRPETSEITPMAYFDLHFGAPQTLTLERTFGEPGSDERVRLRAAGTGTIEDAKQRREAILTFNPNAILLVPILYYSGANVRWYPEDGVLRDLWLRDKNGNRIIIGGEEAALDFTLPETQAFVFDQIRAIAACGLFDGIFFDHWGGGNTLMEERTGRTTAEVHLARDRIIQGARAILDDDMLILVNTGEGKIPRWAEYINGAHMETHTNPSIVKIEGTDNYHNRGYTRADLLDIEDTLVWSESNFREPRINTLKGYTIGLEPPNSPRNKKWMRVFTTMSLTLSDGYVEYAALDGLYGPEVYWHPFYDTPLGRPIGEKGQRYKTPKGVSIEGVFIREYTNGWAVYNRSGKEHNIYLPEKVSGVASGVENKHWHILPDLDGEIYLKKIVPVVDVSGDATVDSEGPSVSFSVPTDTQATAFDITITFTAAVSDFIQEDVSIGGTADASITAWTANADGKTYTATVTPTRSGTVILTVTENVATDTDSRGNSAASSQVVTVFIPDSDVNGDGVTDILDLVVVAQHFGKTVPPNSDVDVNGDGVVSILDLIFVAQRLGGQNAAAAPAIIADTPDAAVIQAWIARAQIEDDGSIVFQQGISKLQELLASLIPKETALLANYPNPFNPETWIPYHLANPSEVQITIYDTRGTLVRRLELGHQRAAHYTRRSRAAYWDGRNAVGERVASGVYFYQLQADNMSLLRKMVILK